MNRIQVGDRAPDVSFTIHTGEHLRLADFQDKKVVVLYFYPKDNTLICTKEACAFRDAYEDFAQAGAVVIGVSSDSTDAHRGFAAQHHLPFYLASDADGSLRQTFGVPKTLGLLPGRVTYVIDRQGVVRLVFNAQMTADRHVKEALAKVKELIG